MTDIELSDIGPSLPLAREYLADVPDDPGVHVIFDQTGAVLYVARNRSVRAGLREHLGGHRTTSTLRERLGEMLDAEWNRLATEREITEWLSHCQFRWRLTNDPAGLKADLVGRFSPPFNGQTPSARTGIWWINQGVNYDDESSAGIIHAATLRDDGRQIGHHQNLRRMRPGDITLHSASGVLRAIGVVVSEPWETLRPYGDPSDRGRGHAVAVEYFELADPPAIGDLPPRNLVGGPFTKNGTLKQGYAFPLDTDWAESLRRSRPWPAGSPWANEPRNHWIIATDPNRWSFVDHLGDMAPGAVRNWKLSTYSQMREGDAIAIWEAGRDAGIYGIATILGKPEEESTSDSSGENRVELVVQLRIVRHISPPILKPQAQADHTLSQLSVLQRPLTGSGFPLTQEQWRALYAAATVVTIDEGEWDALLHWSERFLDSVDLDELERSYKLELAEKLRNARSAMTTGSDWLPDLKRAFGPPNNLTSFYLHGKFLDWAATDPEAAQPALETLWDDDLDPVDAVRTFAAHLPAELSGPGSRANLASFLLMAVDVTQLPIFKFTVFENAYRVVGIDPAQRKTPHGAYAAALDFLDTYRDKLAARGRPQRDRLDAQGLLWTVLSGEGPPTWSTDEQTAYTNFLEGQTVDDLGALVARFREEIGYPPDGRAQRHDERQALDASLTREALTEPDVDEWRRFAGPAYGSPGPQPGFHTLLQTPEGTQRIADAFSYLLYGDGELHERMDALLTGERHVSGLGEALITKALAVTRPDRWSPTYVTRSRKQVGRESILRLLQLPPIPPGMTLGQDAVWSNDTMYQALKPHFPDDSWGMQEFAWWALKRDIDEDDTSPVDPISELASELFLSETWLRKTVKLLHDKRQVVFYGPPGTGKTYVARELAELVARGGGSVEKIQFHPSYAYEDFVEGYRPRTDDAGQISYEIVDGPLKRLAQAAQDRREVEHVLLIDEINRANTSKVLGELYYLLEYRDEEMRLQYSSAPFSLPGNLKIIATMNTADRSIALLDAALRRRFHFLAFFPDREPIDELLPRWLDAHRPEMRHVVDLVRAANAKLTDRNLAIGPSHFLREDLDEETLELVWEHSVLPYLEEQFFANPDQLRDFELDQLRLTVDRQTRAAEEAVDTSAQDDSDGQPREL